MSAAASPAPSEGESQTKRGEVSYRFCQECSNLLYPKEDRATATLLYICKACHATSQHDSACTYRQHLGATVQETAGTTADVAHDPTVGAASPELSSINCLLCGDALRCRKCGQLPDSDDSEGSEGSDGSEYVVS
ncbi:DNA-directed RNA polymerase II core subunit rpb9 [Cladophialophora chaetospira]|uniref:DNA-directed RNA polymerase II core subunit rpb9 n=1 Tax=Cladophialophora chaetospira TaxID=386627 RepID=A0AA39CEL4_9EURO|nr:DNA-directed RNA polymerase II core subunit rpb9 [Cladophialophora chaetospira]